MIGIHPEVNVSKSAGIEGSVRGTRITAGVRHFVKIKSAAGMGDSITGPSCVINSGGVLDTGKATRIGQCVAIASSCTLAGCVIGTESIVRDAPPAYPVQAGNPPRLLDWRE